MLDDARGALASRRPREALAALARYQADYPQGRLAPEAAILHIQALVQLGDLAQANRLATDFLSRHGRSPLVGQVRAIMGDIAARSPDR
jgi:outer membrane protein assembly factor BamD (BamD/ComL family)